MLLRFRQHFFARIVLLAFSTVAFESQQLSAAQESAIESKPNSLRIGDPKGTSKTPAPLGFGRATNSLPLDTQPIANSLLPEPRPAMEQRDVKSLLVNAADTRHLSGSNSDETSVERNDVEDAERMELALKIALASMSHVTPFMWWMAGPTSNLFVDRSVSTENIETESLAETAMPLVDETLEVIDANEPPRLIPATNTGFGSLLPTEEESEEEANEDDTPEPKSPITIAKPTPRTVRKPFEKNDAEPGNESKTADNLPKAVRREQDSQKEQEEPKLDPKFSSSDKDHQGVDALKASKPIINRREIRIDDPANQGIPVAPIIQSKPNDTVLGKRLQRTEACLSHYLNNPESTSVRSPWAVMHALLAYGGEYEMVHGQGRVNAIGWMCHNGTCRTQRMFTPTSRGFTPNVGDGVQGHEGQFLAILAQSNVPLNYPIQIGTSKFTVEDLVRHEMMTCKEKSELTFKLIGLSYYLDSNKQWRANDGKQWSIQKLIQEELAQPIIGAACGGVHRLMGFSFSVKQRQLQGQPVNGQYAKAAKFVREYIDYTWQLQNPDGSFSTSWYEGRANEPNEERKVQTTGHMLEWLMYTLSDDEINTPRVGKSIDFLLSKIYDKREQKWPIGPRGHATRAIALYQDRIEETKSRTPPSAPINSAAKSGNGASAIRK